MLCVTETALRVCIKYIVLSKSSTFIYFTLYEGTDIIRSVCSAMYVAPHYKLTLQTNRNRVLYIYSLLILNEICYHHVSLVNKTCELWVKSKPKQLCRKKSSYILYYFHHNRTDISI